MWGRKRDEGAVVLVPVTGNPELAVRALRDLGDDSPYWRAVVLCAARLQGELVKLARNAQGAERDARVNEAQGVALLLADLNGKREEREKG